MAAKNIYDLDDYSLFKIFNFLDIDEWIELSLTTRRFRRLVREHVIPVQRIKVAGPNVYYSMSELFRMFGKYMTKVEFNGYDYEFSGRTRNRIGSVFEVFLQMLCEYCEPGKIKEVTIWSINEKFQNRLIDEDLLIRSVTYFKNLTSLKIQFNCDDACTPAFEQLLASIPGEQIHSLILFFDEGVTGEAIYDFKLNPNSFPNVKFLHIYEPSNITRLKEVTDFIHGKLYLQEFIYRDLGDDVVRTVAKRFPNIRRLGVIDLNSKHWKTGLEQLKNLKKVDVQGSLTNYREFENVFKISASQKLKYLQIYLNRTEDSSIVESFASFIKSKRIREKLYLRHLSLVINDTDSDWDFEIYCNYLIVNVFDLTTLEIDESFDRKFIQRAVGNVGCLENVLYYDALPSDREYYQQLIMEKLMTNQRLAISKRLTIYCEEADDYVLHLGNDYDPQVIALRPISKWFD